MSKKPVFVRFEVTPEIVERAYEIVKLAKEEGKLRKGANEATKAVERSIAKLLVIAQDVDPPEIVAHLPLLADEKKITYVYVDSKDKLGAAAGIDVPSSAIAVVEAGKGKQLLEEVVSKVEALRMKGAPAKAEAPAEAVPEAPAPKEEKAALAEKAEEKPKEKPKEKEKKEKEKEKEKKEKAPKKGDKEKEKEKPKEKAEEKPKEKPKEKEGGQ